MTEWTNWHEQHAEKIELIPGVDCWVWVGGTTSIRRGRTHGRVRFTNKDGERYSEYAHRAAYISQNGFLDPGSMICHKCGNGLCVRPSHLYEGDYASNGKDMADMGTGSAALTYAQALDVRIRYQRGDTLKSIADFYQIAFGSVYPIVMGKSYPHAPFPDDYSFGNRARQPLTSAEVKDIRSMLSEGATQREIATKHSVAQSIISRINTGKRHKLR